jgi:iron complex transport system substrate-binding protein
MRIVSLLPAATDIVATLNATDLLVGRTHECDWPPGQLDRIPVVTVTNLPEGLTSREISVAVAGGHRGSSIYQLNHDLLADLRPDLILTQDLCDVCAVSYRTVNEAVRSLDLDTRVLSLEPQTIDGVFTAVTTVAEVIGAEPQAAEARAEAHRRLAALPGSPAAEQAPKVLFVEWLDPLMPGGHWVPEQIAYAGGRSVFLSPGSHSVPLHAERVAQADPDIIVFGPCGFTPAQTIAELPVTQAWPRWSEISAVRTGQVWVVDGPAYFNRPGPRVVNGAEILAAIVSGDGHPDAVNLGGR